jgi:acyl carrier protein
MQPTDNQVRIFLREKLTPVLVSRSNSAGANIDDINFVEAGAVDSLGFMKLIREIETQFDTEIDMSEADPEELATISGLVAAVVRPQ